MNGLAGCYVSTIGKPHEYFDLTDLFFFAKIAPYLTYFTTSSARRVVISSGCDFPGQYA